MARSPPTHPQDGFEVSREAQIQKLRVIATVHSQLSLGQVCQRAD
jgi:hypothetical protein